MPLPDRDIGFKVERVDVEPGGQSRKPSARLVVIDPDANRQFVRKIFDAFADQDKKLNQKEGTASARESETG